MKPLKYYKYHRTFATMNKRVWWILESHKPTATQVLKILSNHI